MKRHRVGTVEGIPTSGALIVTVNGIEIGIYKIRGKLVAWRNVCPHRTAPICRGRVAGTRLPTDVYEYEYGREGEIVQCPLHGWEFDLLTGRHLVTDSRAKLAPIPVEVDGDDVYVLTRT